MNDEDWMEGARSAVELEAILASSRAECERLRAQRDRLAELVCEARLIVNCEAWTVWAEMSESALRDLDEELQGG